MRLSMATTVLAATLVLSAHGAQAPQFKSTTNLIIVETTVVGRDGVPVADLKADDFTVTIDGRRRSVVSADFVRAGSAEAGVSQGTPTSATGAPAGHVAGRIVVIAIDEHSFPVAAQASAREAAMRIVDRAEPGDQLALIAMPGPLTVGPTTDSDVIRKAITGIGGKRVDAPRTNFNISGSEAATLKGRSSMSVSEIINRECKMTDASCRQELLEAGSIIADALERQGILTIDGLHGVLDTIAGMSGRKLLFVVSAGLPTTNQAGGRPNMTAETERIARRAAAANVNLYVFYVNVHFMQHFSAATGWRSPSALYDDISMFGSGLERFADSAGGGFFQVEVDSDPFVDRAFRETASSYLLGVRPETAEFDGKEHQIRVSVSRRGVTVRFRRFVVIPGLAQVSHQAP